MSSYDIPAHNRLIKCGRNVTTTPHYHLSTADVRSCYNGQPTQAFTRDGHLLAQAATATPAPTTRSTSFDRDAFNLSSPTAAVREANANRHTSNNLTLPAPTDKQLNYYHDLCKAKGTTPHPAPATYFTRQPGHPRSISAEIDRLKALPKPAPRPDHSNQPDHTANGTPTPSFRAPYTPVDDGVYLHNNTYYKVVTSQETGRRYAKAFNPTTKKFNRAPGAIRHLTPAHAVTPAQARTFGKLYGICCFCGRTLTDERSIGAGYGPTCAQNYGLPWGDHTATPIDTTALKLTKETSRV